MTELDPHRDLLVDATTVDDLARSRLRTGVRAELAALRQLDELARTATAPPAVGARRVRARFAIGDLPRRAWTVPVLVAAGVAAVAVAAVLWSRDAHPVALDIAGQGQVSGPPEAPVVELADGRVDAEVEPNRGTLLRVRTPEATVTVIGTTFSVDRAAFATTVAVKHGTVEVACDGKAPVPVTTGGTARCLPASAAGLLRRIVALGPGGGAEAREAVDAGLAAPDAVGGLRAELLAHEVRLLATAGDPAAVEAARQYLETGEVARRAEMVAFVASQRFARERCAAIDDLERAVREDPGTVLAVALASCVADPVRADALLDGVADPGAWRPLYDEVRARIGP